MYETPGSVDSGPSSSVANGLKIGNNNSNKSVKIRNTDGETKVVDDEGETSIWMKASSPAEIVHYYESIGNWNRSLPKTDYTYSPTSMFYNKEIAPGIPTIPNMSRVTIDEYKNLLASDINNHLQSSWTATTTATTTTSSSNRRSYCTYGTDIDQDLNWPPQPTINNHNITMTVKIKTFLTRIFSWLYITLVFQSVSIAYGSIVTVVNRTKNFLYNSSSADRNRRIIKLASYFLVPLLLLLIVRFTMMKTASNPFQSRDLLLISSSFVDDVADRTTSITEGGSVIVRTAFSKIGSFVLEIIQPGIDVPLLVMKTLLSHLIDIVVASTLLVVTGLRQGVQLLPNYRFNRSSSSSSSSEEPVIIVDHLNYTKLAETLLSMDEFKETLTESSKDNLNKFADQLKQVAERSRHDANDVSPQMLNSTLVEDVVRKYAESIIEKMLLENQLIIAADAKNRPNYLTEDRLNYVVSGLTRNLTKNFNDDMKNIIARSLKQSETDMYSLVEKRLTESSSSSSSSIVPVNFTSFEAYINRTVQRALKIYDADKTGLVDYALETSGGVILNTRCTETLKSPISFTVLNIPLWRMQTNPRIVIQPGVHPGQCWAFAGSIGFLVIQLSQKILVTGFTVEHIPKLLAPNGAIDSAPREFSVWGLFHETKLDSELFLGRFTYNADSEDSVQYFPAIEEARETPFQIVELRVESNHGKVEYTCIYRFRVHGIPFK